MFILGESLHDLGTQVHSHSADQRGHLDLVDPVHSAQLLQPADDASDARGSSLATVAGVRFVQTGSDASASFTRDYTVIVVFQQSSVYSLDFRLKDLLCLYPTIIDRSNSMYSAEGDITPWQLSTKCCWVTTTIRKSACATSSAHRGFATRFRFPSRHRHSDLVT